MEAQDIITLIKKRREIFWDRQIIGCADDPLVWSDASCDRKIADEYDSLLEEIGRLNMVAK